MDVLFITGDKYVEYIRELPAEKRTWYHTSYLWYHANAHRVLLCISIILTIYLAITYREVFAVANRSGGKTIGRKNKPNVKYHSLEQAGGFDLFANNADAQFSESVKSEPTKQEQAAPANETTRQNMEAAAASRKRENAKEQEAKEKQIADSKAASQAKKQKQQEQVAQQKSERKAEKQLAHQARIEAKIASSPEAIKQRAKEAKLAAKREKQETKQALRDEKYGKQSQYRSETAMKNIKAIKDAPGKLKEYAKSGQMKADVKEKYMQAKLKAHEKAVALQESIVQNASGVYKWIFTIFIVMGFMVYFMPTIGMIGLSILTFYMFRNFVNDMLTL